MYLIHSIINTISHDMLLRLNEVFFEEVFTGEFEVYLFVPKNKIYGSGQEKCSKIGNSSLKSSHFGWNYSFPKWFKDHTFRTYFFWNIFCVSDSFYQTKRRNDQKVEIHDPSWLPDIIKSIEKQCSLGKSPPEDSKMLLSKFLKTNISYFLL